jgi:hypothetical protein
VCRGTSTLARYPRKIAQPQANRCPIAVAANSLDFKAAAEKLLGILQIPAVIAIAEIYKQIHIINMALNDIKDFALSAVAIRSYNQSHS